VTEQIIESSRRLYARPREDVEREITEWSGMTGGPGNSSSGEGEGKFKAVCSACGKETTVPFEPEPGRPIYCKDCIAKIKSGELKPVKGVTRARALEPQSFAPLANLGIEFAPEKSEATKPFVAVAPTPRPVEAPKPSQQTFVRPVSRPAVHTVTSSVQTQNPPVSRPARMIPVVKVEPLVENKIVGEQKVSSVVPPSPVVRFNPVAQKVTVEKTPEKPKPIFTKIVAPVKQKPIQNEPIIKKGPDHEGLQSILKQALGETITKNEIKVKVEAPKAPIVEEKKTISLSSLKKPEINNGFKMQNKVASDEHVSSLAEAIARARNSVAKQSPVEPKQAEPEKEKVPDMKAEEKIPPKNEEEAPKKKIKEVPEDILRKVLNE
jgi:CxxC-x17-CxxC domain-containing protein